MLSQNINKTDRLQRTILGSIMLDERLFFEINDVIMPIMFSGWLAGVADLIWSQIEDDGKFSPAVLAHDANTSLGLDESAIYELAQFADSRGLKKNAEKLKLEYHRQQEVIIHRNAIEKLEQGELPEQVIADAQSDRDLLHDFSGDENQTRSAKVMEWFDKILSAKDSKMPVGIETPFKGINMAFGGLHLTNYNIIAGRPGMGKTTLLLDLIYHAVCEGVPALFFSLEMSYNEILSLLAQKATGVLNKNMRMGKVTDKDILKIQSFMERLYELPIYIETGVFHISDIKHKARMYSRKYGIKLVGIDYLQLISIRDFRSNRNSEMEKISRGLKQLASEKDCNVCLICLAQLSRAVETRGGSKRPQLSDLRDSGSLEQDADNIMFTYRADYYGIEQDQEGNSTKGKVEVMIRKNRHVSDGLRDVILSYDPIHNRLSDPAGYTEEETDKHVISPIQSTSFNPDETEVPF